MAQKGNIGVTTENIFPVIKKFLYSDHDIFLREMVSNAVDATQKLKTLAAQGDFKGEIGDTTVRVSLDEKAGTLTISDHGIGMTEEEIDKYINQIAFSGVTDFLDKYKENANAIIGHFGLGFYSSFMVASKVEIITKSYKEGSKAVKWSCDGSPAFEIEDADKAERGSDIILHIADDCKEFLQKNKIAVQGMCAAILRYRAPHRCMPPPHAAPRSRRCYSGCAVHARHRRSALNWDAIPVSSVQARRRSRSFRSEIRCWPSVRCR